MAVEWTDERSQNEGSGTCRRGERRHDSASLLPVCRCMLVLATRDVHAGRAWLRTRIRRPRNVSRVHRCDGLDFVLAR